MGIKQSHLMCTFIIWCLFPIWYKCSENGLGTVAILALVRIGYTCTISTLKQEILDQTRQNGYQTVPFGMYIHNLMFVCILVWVFWKEVVIVPLIHNGHCNVFILEWRQKVYYHQYYSNIPQNQQQNYIEVLLRHIYPSSVLAI